MVTIKDVAERAEVSISTISRVLNGTANVAADKRDAVLKAVAELDYQPSTIARALVGHRTGMIGLLVNNFADPFFGTLIRGVEQQAAQYGMQVIATEGHHQAEQEEAALRALLARRCDALIIHALALSDWQLAGLTSHCPSIVVNRSIPELESHCLWFDNDQAGYLAAQYLLGKGHSRIGWIGRDEDIADNRDRFTGFCRALQESGIPRQNAPVESAPATAAGGYQATSRLLTKHPDLTAIQAYNDAMAAGCLRALHERNLRLPDQFSVVGVDDVYLGEYLYPQLTTIRYPIETIGQQAVHRIHALLTNSAFDADHCFKPELIERGSVFDISRKV